MSKQEQSPFAELLEELETMSKAFPDESDEGVGDDKKDDKKIQAAADGDLDEDGKPDGEDPDVVGDEDDEYDDMAKSLGVEAMEIEVDGEKQKVYDGLVMLKAMSERNEASEEAMFKALSASVETMKGMGKKIADQGDLIKSLQVQVADFGSKGKGRKAVLSVLDKPGNEGDLHKSEGIEPKEILNKALTAQREKKITGTEVSAIDSYVGRGLAPPAHLLKKIGIAG